MHQSAHASDLLRRRRPLVEHDGNAADNPSAAIEDRASDGRLAGTCPPRRPCSPGFMTRDVDAGDGVRIRTLSFHHERPFEGTNQP
jgi:hypothetical protein